jgi:hypothetical protein
MITLSTQPPDTKSCEVCGIAFSRPKRFNRRSWAKVRFCSQKCMGIERRIDPLVRLKRSVIIDHKGCWLWQLYKDRGGYGRMLVNYKSRSVPRLSFELYCGPIPPGLQLHHKCNNRGCCNPLHMELLTPSLHLDRSPKSVTFINKFKTHCVRGHEFTKENTYIDRRGGRNCRKCMAIHRRKYKASKLTK